MIIEKAILEGFGSYRDRTEIVINQGITAIIASYDENSKRSNGGGKSQIVMSILYALYGTGEFNILSELINDNCDNMSVELFFKLNGNNYYILRGIQKKSSFLDFFQNDNRIGKSIDETQKEIINVIGMDYEMFSSSIFFEQGQLDKFINVSADKRREYIDKVLGLEIWRNLGKEAVKIKKDFEKNLKLYIEEKDNIKDIIEKSIPIINQKSVIETELLDNNSKKTELNVIIDKYNEIYKNMVKLEGIKSQIKDLESQSLNLKGKLDVENKKVFDITKFDEQILNLTGEQKNLQEKLVGIEAEHIKLDTEYNEIQKNKINFTLNISQMMLEIENQKKHKNNVLSGTCPTCHQIVDTQLLENENKSIDEQINILNDRLKEQQGFLNEIESKLNDYLKQIGNTGTIKNEMSSRISNISNELYKLNVNKTNEISNSNNQIKVIDYITKELQDSVNKLSEKILERDSIKIESMDIDIKVIQNQIQIIDKKINELNIRLGSIINEEKRKDELEEKLKIIKKNIDDTEKNVYIYQILSESYQEIPRRIFLESVTLIEEESNKLLQQVLPNINVKIFEDDKKKNLPIVIAFIENGNERSYRRLSGGQKAVCNICIRLAFSFIIMNKAKVSLNFLVLDEIFSNLDAENRELVKGLFPTLSSFFKQMILITHTEDLNEFPNILTIGKTTDGISYLK